MSIFTKLCKAVDNKFFTTRQKLIDQMLDGKACDNSYKLIYPGTFAETFDPISKLQTPSVVCTQIVDEIETLVTENHADEVNSLRYSYLVSLSTDIEV